MKFVKILFFAFFVSISTVSAHGDEIEPLPTILEFEFMCYEDSRPVNDICAYQMTVYGKMEFTLLRVSLQQELNLESCAVINESYITSERDLRYVAVIRGTCERSVWFPPRPPLGK